MLDSHLPASGLLNRISERDALDRLVAGVRAGQSRVLVLRGAAGVGKTALLGHLSTAADGCRVASAAGVESEMELAFASLHALCSSMLGRVEHLPGPQRDALNTAFGVSAGPPPDRFLVGLAVLSLLAAEAEEQPLVCIVDDAQWLDLVSAQTLAFVARRLLAERIGLVFALRESDDQHALDGLPELAMAGLPPDEARQLLAASIPGRLDARVRDRILFEAGGNPLALLELPRGGGPTAVAGGFGLPGEMPLSTRLEKGFVLRLKPFGAETRRLLLLAAAEPVGDAPLLWRAARLLGIGPEAAGPAETAGLIEIGARVRFRHPLVRSAAYRDAPMPERRDVHRALAESIDPEVDPDRRAWHRAQAAVGLDEDVAGELERSADRAQARGGTAAAAAFLLRATELTPDPERRGVRALLAARAQFDAGAHDTASELLATAEIGPLEQLQQAQAERLRADLAFARRRGSDAPPLLLKAARRLEPLDPELARDTYLEALSAALYVGRMTGHAGVIDVAEAARAALAAARTRRPPDLLLDGLAVLVIEGYPAGAQVLRKALSVFRDAEDSSEEVVRWLWLAERVAGYVWDEATWDVATSRHLQHARDAGALTELPLALAYRASLLIHAGDLGAAARLIDEASALAQSSGSAPLRYASLMLAAWQGDEERVSVLIATLVAERVPRDEDRPLAPAEWMLAVLYNALGRYAEALACGERATRHAHELGPTLYALPELIEAAARGSNLERAGDALQRLTETTRASGGDWALGIEARSRALVSDGDLADSLYREAVERLARTRGAVHLARAQLVYGEWLRRENRRIDAREQLRGAHDTFSRCGAAAFAERARRELLATGETVRKRSVETLDELTTQEAQVAQLAAEGRTNPEIGAQLFISPRTVEYHLRKVFTKLDIASRKELRAALQRSSHAGIPA
jgi:DNA-binding CsgD family transcriptional regulator/tetratricopeptide (TPR) repeat protein